MRFEFQIKAPDADRRLDRYVQAALGQVPAGLVQRLLRQKKVRVNGERVPGSYRLRTGDTIVVHHAAKTASSETTKKARETRRYAGPAPTVLHRSDDYLCLAKPAGIACSDDGIDLLCLPLWLGEHLAAEIKSGTVRPEPCHRLDRGTTGVVVVALTAVAHDRFRRGLEAGEIEKHYEVAVWGQAPDRFDCDLALKRVPTARRGQPRAVAVESGEEDPRAQEASTRFERRAFAIDRALLAAWPRTGRTHQIRAHCRAMGLAVIGDPRYGDPTHREREAEQEIDHPLLHARRLLWRRNGEVELDVETGWPALESSALQNLGLSPLR